jgi:hypothetical protein
VDALHNDGLYSCKFRTNELTSISIKDGGMPNTADLATLVEDFAAAIPELNLDSDELEEYSTMLLRLQNQFESGEPIEWIVNECLNYLNGAVALTKIRIA